MRERAQAAAREADKWRRKAEQQQASLVEYDAAVHALERRLRVAVFWFFTAAGMRRALSSAPGWFWSAFSRPMAPRGVTERRARVWVASEAFGVVLWSPFRRVRAPGHSSES